MRTRPTAWFVATVTTVILAGCSEPAATSDASAPLTPADRALAYLADAPDSAIPGILAAVAGHVDIHAWPTDDPLADRLVVPERGGDLLRFSYGLAVADPGRAADLDLIDRVGAGFADYGYGDPSSMMDDAWAVRAWIALGVEADNATLARAIEELVSAQDEAGGWSWNGAGSSPDETAWVAAALVSAGASFDRPATLAYLAAAHDEGRYEASGVGANCQSTGLAAQAWQILAAAPPAGTWAYLASCQNEDGGFAHQPGGPSSMWVTTDILPAYLEAGSASPRDE